MSDILNRIIKADNQMVGANPAFVANTYLQDPSKLEGLYNTVLQSAMGDLQFRTDYEQLGDKEKQAKKDRYIKRAQEELGRYRVLSGASKKESLIGSLPEMQDEELVNWAERYNTETKSTLQTEPGSFGAETKKLLQKYRVESFEKEISKGHNTGHIPNVEYAMAFDIYDKFGSEGLTEFINYATKGGKVASTQFDMNAFTEKLVQQESSGRADARNKGVDGKNTAAGRYQFVNGTLARYVKRIKPDVIGSDAEIAGQFRGTEVEDAAFRLMTTDNIGILKAKGLPVTELNVYFAHLFGPGDAPKVLQASDDTPIESVIRAKSYKQNPELHGKTIAEVKEFYAKKFDDKEPLKVDEEADFGILNNDILESAASFAKSVRFSHIKLKDKELYNRDYNEFTSQFYETGNINEFLKSKVDLSIDGKVPKFGDPNTYVSPREAFYAAGYDEDDYRAKLVQLHRNAVNSPEQSGLDELIQTVFANHSGVVNEGAVVIDEKNMSFPGKMALEVLRYGGSSEKMFYRDEDNRLVFEPGRVQRLSELATKTFSVTKKVPNVVNGTWDGTFNEVRDDSWLNFPMDVWYGLRKFNTTTATALMETVFDMENMDSKLIRSEYEKMRDVLDSEADAGALPFMVGYMIPAIVTAKLTGGVALSAAATVTRGAAGIRSAVALNNAVRFGANLNSGGRLANLANKLGVMATRTAPQMFAGAPIALTAPDPMADDIGAMLVSAGVSEEFAEQLGKGLGGGTGIVGGAIAGYRYGGLPGAAVGGAIGGLAGAPTGEYLVKENREAIAKTGAALEDWYYASDAFTRTAVSIIAEDVLLGSVIDNIFGGIRYAKHARLVKDGKFSEVPGLKYKGYGDEFEAIKDATEFKGTDYIFRELKEELAVLNNKEFMAEANLGRAIKDYVGTVNRASRKTGQIYNISAVDEELTLLRQQIKDTIENNDKRFGVETQNLDTRTEKIYSDVMSRLAKDIDTSFSLVKYEGAGDFVNELVTTGNGMKVQEFNTYRDALTAKKGKKDAYIVTVENKHLLYELSDNTWRKDLLRNLSERFKNPARVKEERLNAIYRKLGITETSHPDVAFKLMEDIDNIKIADDISEYKKMKDAYDAKKKAEDAAKAAADKQAEQAARQAEQDAKLAAEKTKLDELNAKLAKEAELKAEIDRKHKEAKEALEAASADLNSGETGFIQKVVELNRAADEAMGKKVKKGKATLAEKIEVALEAGVGSWGDLKGLSRDGEVTLFNSKYRGKHKGKIYFVKGQDGPEFYYGMVDNPKTEPGTKIIDKDTGTEMPNPEWHKIEINEGYDINTNTLDKGTAKRVKDIVEAKAADKTIEVKAGEKLDDASELRVEEPKVEEKLTKKQLRDKRLREEAELERRIEEQKHRVQKVGKLRAEIKELEKKVGALSSEGKTLTTLEAELIAKKHELKKLEKEFVSTNTKTEYEDYIPSEFSEKQSELFKKLNIQKAGLDKDSLLKFAGLVGLGTAATAIVESIQDYLSGEENPTSDINKAFIVGAIALGAKVGPNAPKFKQQMQGALTIAKQMDKLGKPIEDIVTKTGWSKNPLGQWHTSILDQLQFKPGKHKLTKIGKNSVQFKLGSVADGKIFELYPELKDLKIRIEGKKKSGTRGSFIKKDWAIDLYSFKGKAGERISELEDLSNYMMSEEETVQHIAGVKETLYHEIQHAIQKLEEFPTGSNFKHAKESWEGYKNILRNDSAIERKVWANEFESVFSRHGNEFGKFGKMLSEMFLTAPYAGISSTKDNIRDLFGVWIEREYLGGEAHPKAVKFAIDTLTPKLNSILDSIDDSFFTELKSVKKYEAIEDLKLPTNLVYHNTYGEYQARVAASAAVSDEAKIATKNENWTDYGNMAQYLHEQDYYKSPIFKPFIDNFGGDEYNPLLATAGIAGAAIITEDMLDEEPQEVKQAGIGSGIGKLLTSMAAGVETGYKTAIGTFRSRKAKLGDDIVDDIVLAKNLVLEKEARENLVFDVHGLITPKSEVEKTRLKEQVLNKFDDLVQKGGWFENPYMQTAYNFLVKVSPEQGRRIAEFFRGSELSVARQTALVRNMYHSTAKEFGVDLPYEKVETEVAPQIIRGVVDEINSASGVTANVSEEGIRKQFGEAFFRIMESTTGENPAAVKQMYEAGRAGQIYQMIDQRLMQDESFRTYIEAHRRAYANINDEAVTLINDAIGNEIKSLMIPDRFMKIGKEKFKLEEAINLLELYRNSYLNGKAITTKEFEDSLPAKDLLIWKRMKKVDDVKNVIKKVGLRNSLYNNRAGNYVPQMLSRKAIDESKARFVRDANLIGLKAEEVDKLWMEQVFMPQFLDINEKKTRGYGKKLTYSAGGGVTEKIFKTSNRAYSEFKREFDALPQDVQRQVTEYIGGPMSEAKLKELGFIKENEKIATTADGKPVILASGNSKKVKEYTLNLPEDFKVDYDGKEFDIFKESNRAQLELLQNDLISHLNALYRGEVVRNSKFLENPRNYELPYFVRETNPDAVWRIYSYDTGTRLHFLRKGIWDEADLNRELIDPLTRDVHSKVGDNSEAATANIGRIINVYRLMTDSARDLHAEADPAGALRQRKKALKLAGLFTGWEFMKRGFGFTQFDALDALSRGAVFTSYDARDKAVKYYWRNQKSQQVMERLLADMGLIREQFRYLQPEFTTIDPAFGGDAGLNTIEKWMDKGMNMVSDFSPINVLNKTWNKMTGSNTMWNDAGAHRLIPMVGSLNNMSRMNTGTMAYMFLAEANEMAKAFTQIEEGAEFAFVNGRQLSRRDIIDKMTLLGVTEERIPNFVADNIKYQEFLSTITESPELARDFFTENPEFFRDIQDIFTTATQTYNGSSKLFRPEAWHSPWGRILSMYMNFDTNTGFQVLKRRIVDPIKEWQDNHNVNGELGFFSIAADIKAGKFHKLRQAGMSDEAIEQFPIEAVNTMGRAIGHIGLTAVYLTSLDLMKQMMSYPFATEEEQSKMWEEWKIKQVTLNPRAPEKYRVTIVDAFDSEDVFRDSMRMLLFATAKVAQSGVTGVYGSTVGNIERAIDQGPMTLFPATSIAQRQFTDFGKTLISPIDYQDGNVPHAVGQLILNNTPIVSGSYFSYIRNTVLDKIKPEKKRNIKVNFGDGRTGTANDIFSVQGDMYEFDFD